MSRVDKINSELRHHISVIIQQELKDPGIGFVTVTSVSTSPGLRRAAVYFTCMGTEEERKKTQDALERAAGYIKKLLNNHLCIKFIPDIKFIYDDTFQQKKRIDRIFEDIHREENDV